MGVRILGIGRSKGEYEGYKYDNFLLHCVEPAPKGWAGERSLVAKVPASVFNADLLPLVDGDIDKLIGVTVDLAYNRFGKITAVRLSDA